MGRFASKRQKQNVDVNNCMSEDLLMNEGVPQVPFWVHYSFGCLLTICHCKQTP